MVTGPLKVLRLASVICVSPCVRMGLSSLPLAQCACLEAAGFQVPARACCQSCILRHMSGVDMCKSRD